MNGKLISYGVAALIGLLVAIAYYELIRSGHSPQTVGSFAEVIAAGDKFSGSATTETFEIEAEGLQGNIKAVERGRLLILHIKINSDSDTTLHGKLRRDDLEFKGAANQTDGHVEGFLFAKGNFSMSKSTTKDFVVAFSLPEDPVENPDNRIEIVITQDSEIILRETFVR